MKLDCLVVVRGGGDLGTGVAHRLVRAGYRVVVLETESPRAVRRRVAFAEAVRAGTTAVEGIEARLVDPDGLERLAGTATDGPTAEWPRWIPVVVDPEGDTLTLLHPDAIVDARMIKRRSGGSEWDAWLTIGLGPGFEAGVDVDLVVETKRGQSLGRVITTGSAAADTGVPGAVAGVAAERVLRAPADGVFEPARSIGDLVEEGDAVGVVGGRPAVAGVSGVVRGLLAGGLSVRAGDKLGDVDPRGADIDPDAMSDKARAIGGAVLEALLSRGVFPGSAGREAC